VDCGSGATPLANDFLSSAAGNRPVAVSTAKTSCPRQHRLISGYDDVGMEQAVNIGNSREPYDAQSSDF